MWPVDVDRELAQVRHQVFEVLRFDLGDVSVRRIATESRVVVHDIDPEIAALAVQLPESVPKDPADRLIVATAVAKAFPLVTKDARIHEAGACDVIW